MEWSLAVGVWVESRAAITPERTRDGKMSIRTIIALSAAIVLSTAATASAATKKQKVPSSGPQARAIAPRGGGLRPAALGRTWEDWARQEARLATPAHSNCSVRQ